ncbi:MAG: hypothetical protein R3Y28_04275 [Candidatus Gastranaerophilales bacterium]
MKKLYKKITSTLNPTTPNLQIFDCDEKPLLNRIQGGSRIPLQ